MAGCIDEGGLIWEGGFGFLFLCGFEFWAKEGADKRRNCKSPVETQVYKLKKSLVCVACCRPVSEDISEKSKETKTKFSTVLPNCEDEKCLKFMIGIDKGPYKGWICKRPKKQSNKEIINEKKRRHEEAKQRMNQAKKQKKE